MSVGAWVTTGCCCCALAGGGIYIASQTSDPPPPTTTSTISYTTTSTLPQQTVPEPSRPTTSNPVFGAQLPSDAARTSAQLPIYRDAHQLDGTDALSYVNALRRIIPGTRWYFVVLDQVLSCAQSEGVVAARAYIGGDYRSATTVVVLSSDQLQNLGQVALDCAFKKLPTSGGGPTGGFSPCASAYYYDDTTSGAPNRYFVFVASTSQQWCSSVQDFHGTQLQHELNRVWSVGL